MTVCAAALNAASPLLHWPYLLVPVIGSLSLLLISAGLKDPFALQVSIIVFLITWNGLFWNPHWPFPLLVPLALYFLAVLATGGLRRNALWLRAGRPDRLTWVFSAFIVLVSSAGLISWFFLFRPDLTKWLRAVPDFGPVLLVPTGIGFAVLNAALEESVYRGIVMQGLDAAFGAGWLSVILQAVPFGAMHIHGIPNGGAGVVMAVIYGLMLGFIRRRSRGMLAPFVTHVFADMVIFFILVAWAR